jgi:hypothetical protein
LESSVKPSWIRANLTISGAVELTDPDGTWWTVYVIRTGEPHPAVYRHSRMLGWGRELNILRRLLTRERTWDVEVIEGTDRWDLTSAEFISRATSKADALRQAEAVAIAVGDGQRPPKHAP